MPKKLEFLTDLPIILLTSLIDMGFIKLSNFKDSSQKIKYSYLLTPKGIREKSLVTSKFLVRKKHEYETLREEINSLEKSLGNVLNDEHEDD